MFFFTSSINMFFSTTTPDQHDYSSDIGYVLFRACTFLIRTSWSLFTTYCVCNTVAPVRTRRCLTNAAWWTLELYTICELNAKRKVTPYIETVYDKLKKLRPCQQTTDNTSDTLCSPTTKFINEQGQNDVIRKPSSLFVLHRSSSGLTRVLPIDEWDKDSQVEPIPTGYKFMACSVKLYDGKSIDIDLSGKNTLTTNNYYAVGNHILSKEFLKYYVANEIDMNCVVMQSIHDALDEPYNVHVLDHNANLVTIKSDSYMNLANEREYTIEKCQKSVDKTEIDVDNVTTVQEKNKTI